jgi:Phage minor structural protein GP20
VKELRGEAAENRRKATEFETKFNQTSTQLTEMQQKLRQRDVRDKVAELATDLKITSATAAAKLLDMSKVKFDKDGNPENVKELLEELIKSETFLLTPATSTSTSPTNPGREGAKFTREQIEKMTTDEINANWAEVQKVLAAV